MLGTPFFKPVLPFEFHDFAQLVYPDSLGLSDADADVGVMPRGKSVAIADYQNLDELKFANGKEFFGVLVEDVDQNGTKGDTGFRKVSLGYREIPTRRGLAVPVRWFAPGSFIEVESGLEDAIESLLQKTAIGGAADNSFLTFSEKGCWKPVAADGSEFAFGILRDQLTPEVAGNTRALIELVSPFLI